MKVRIVFRQGSVTKEYDHELTNQSHVHLFGITWVQRVYREGCSSSRSPTSVCQSVTPMIGTTPPATLGFEPYTEHEQTKHWPANITA